MPSHALREISLMKELAHPQIVRCSLVPSNPPQACLRSLYDVVLRFNTLFLILEFMEQDLSHMLHQRDCGLSATLLKVAVSSLDFRFKPINAQSSSLVMCLCFPSLNPILLDSEECFPHFLPSAQKTLTFHAKD